jgi:hypothetical protein
LLKSSYFWVAARLGVDVGLGVRVGVDVLVGMAVLVDVGLGVLVEVGVGVGGVAFVHADDMMSRKSKVVVSSDVLVL